MVELDLRAKCPQRIPTLAHCSNIVMYHDLTPCMPCLKIKEGSSQRQQHVLPKY